jgi:hypothetical protein
MPGMLSVVGGRTVNMTEKKLAKYLRNDHKDHMM